VEITRQQDPVNANEIEAWAKQLQSASAVLPMDAACFQEYARLIHGRSETFAEDAMIAATARVHGLTVATRNERDFRPLGVAVFNPFKT
jgi:toxin FitB